MTSASLPDASQNLLDTQKSNAVWKKDRKNIFLIFILYIIQALPQGILFISIPVTLTSKGAKYNDLIIITMSYIPFCFKSFVSPILNRYYSKKFGRGKTYIVPSQYIIGLILLFLAYQGDKIFELESIPWLSAVSIITIITLMPADISLDGWMVNLISAENSSYGAVCQSIGFNLGFFLSFNLFLPLSSVEFCNSYIYSTPQETAVIPVGPYIAIMALAIILFTAWIQFFFKEEEPINQSPGSFADVVKTLKVFFLNKHFRKLFFIYCTWNIIFGPIHNLYPGLIMEKGVSKELFTNLNTPITPMLFVITIWLGALCKKHPETQVANTFWISRLLATFFIYATIVYLHIIPEEFKVPALFTASFLSSISFNGIAVALGAFASRVAKETYGGPVMSTFGAIGCFSRLVSDVFMFTLLNLLGWDNLALLTLGGMFIYAVVFIKGMNSFENQNLKSLLEPKVKTE